MKSNWTLEYDQNQKKINKADKNKEILIQTGQKQELKIGISKTKRFHKKILKIYYLNGCTSEGLINQHKDLKNCTFN